MGEETKEAVSQEEKTERTPLRLPDTSRVDATIERRKNFLSKKDKGTAEYRRAHKLLKRAQRRKAKISKAHETQLARLGPKKKKSERA